MGLDIFLKPCRRAAFGLLSLFVLCGAAPSTLEPRRSENAPSSIIMQAEPGGVRLTYELAEPTMRVEMKDLERLPEDADVNVQGVGMNISAGVISGTTPFRRIVLHVKPTRVEKDSVYPVALPLGNETYAIFAPYFIPSASDMRIVRDTGSKFERISLTAAQGYVLVGASPRRRNDLDVFFAQNVPAALAAEITHKAERIMAFYRKRVGVAPPVKPTIIMSLLEGDASVSGSKRRGDLGENGVIFIRVPSRPGTPASQQDLDAFLAHELYHLWNGRIQSADVDWWLHEGGAEYASWRAVSSLWPEPGYLTRKIDAAMRECVLYLGTDPLRALDGSRARRVRYPCGAIVHWIVDLSAGRSRTLDTFDIMRASMRREGRYSYESFRDAVARSAPAADAPLANLIDRGGPDRWKSLAVIVKALGADIHVTPPSDFFLRLGAAKALVASACRSLTGVGEDNGKLYVQAEPSCRLFGPKAFIERVADLDPMKYPLEVNEAVRSSCARRDAISLRIRSEAGAESDAVIRCSVEVEVTSPSIKVASAGIVGD